MKSSGEKNEIKKVLDTEKLIKGMKKKDIYLTTMFYNYTRQQNTDKTKHSKKIKVFFVTQSILQKKAFFL